MKIKQGKIYEIEAIGFTLPYGTRSGWEQIAVNSQ